MVSGRTGRGAGAPVLPAAESGSGGSQLRSVLRESVQGFYHEKLGRPSLPPGMYFRLMLIGFFEGIDSERGIAWRVADSLSLRQFLQIGLDEQTPDHVTISRTRRLMDEPTHQEVFGWVLRLVAERGLLKGKTIGIDATTLEANAAMRSIVRRDSGGSYTDYLQRLADSLFPAIELEGVDPVEAAAWFGVCRLLLNLDEFITRS